MAVRQSVQSGLVHGRRGPHSDRDTGPDVDADHNRDAEPDSESESNADTIAPSDAGGNEAPYPSQVEIGTAGTGQSGVVLKYALAVSLLLVLALSACGGADKASTTTPLSSPASVVAATPAPPVAAATTAATPVPPVSAAVTEKAKDVVAGAFSTLFGNAFFAIILSLEIGAPRLDPALAGYLPPPPAGFKLMADVMHAAADTDVSPFGSRADIALRVSSRGNSYTGPADAGRVVVAVARPEQPGAFAETAAALPRLSEQHLRDVISANEDNSLGLTIQKLRLLESGGLGSGSIAFELTAKPGGVSGSGEPGAPAPDLFVIRLYLFERGGYFGAVLRVGYTDPLPDLVNDLELARTMYALLPATP